MMATRQQLGKRSRNKGAAAERDIKNTFVKHNIEATRTGSGICPDFKGDVIVKLFADDVPTTLLCEVKHLKDAFITQYEALGIKKPRKGEKKSKVQPSPGYIVMQDEEHSLANMLLKDFLKLVTEKKDLRYLHTIPLLKYDKDILKQYEKLETNGEIITIIKKANNKPYMIAMDYDSFIRIRWYLNLPHTEVSKTLTY